MLYVNPVDALQTGASATEGVRRQAALKELDQMFAFQLLQEMRKTVPKDSLLGGSGMEQDTYNEMLDDAFAGDMAKSGQFGVAAQVQAQLEAVEAQQRQPVRKDGFVLLHPETEAVSLNAGNRSGAPSYIPLRRNRMAAEAYSLIKAPMRLADN